MQTQTTTANHIRDSIRAVARSINWEDGHGIQDQRREDFELLTDQLCRVEGRTVPRPGLHLRVDGRHVKSQREAIDSWAK